MLASLLWTIFIVLIIAWLVCFLIVHIGGGLIHILLIVAAVILLYNLLVGARRRV